MKKQIILLMCLVLLLPLGIQAQVSPNSGIEARVREYFADIPDLITVAKCESGFRQFTSSGSPLYDPSGTYIGVFQIDESIHSANAASLGWDIATLEGNLSYTRYLYGRNGISPWRGCITTTTPVVNPSTSPITGQITSYFRAGMTSPQVRLVQQLLNKNGFSVASSGPGSPGNETEFFGALTREAVRKFQCAKGIVCEGNEMTTGYGRVGPKTQATLNALIGL